MQPKKKTEPMGITALYCRLSRDDGTDGDSNSVANQKRLLTQKARELGLGNTKFYVDDGYTGREDLIPAEAAGGHGKPRAWPGGFPYCHPEVHADGHADRAAAAGADRPDRRVRDRGHRQESHPAGGDPLPLCGLY